MTRRATVAAACAAALVLAGVAAAGGTASFDVQANEPQVQGDPGSDATAVFPTNKQNEPTIAVNPVDPRFLIAGSNDEQRQPPCGPGPVRGTDAPANDCSFFPGVGTSGVYTSSDGGVTWTNRGLLDDQPAWIASPFVSDGDPVIVYGPKPDEQGGFSYGNGVRAYYATLASYKPGQSPYPPQKAPELLAVSYSDDNGLTWSAPAVVTVKKNPNDFNDKESLWVDDLPSSPYFGRVYVSWTEFRSALQLPAEPVQVAISTDGGRTFGPPKKLSPAFNNNSIGGRQGSAVRTGPDGTAYVAWEEGNSQVVAVSRNGGAKWSRPVVIGAVADLDDPIPGANFRTDSFLSIAADPRSGSTTLYAAWANRTAAGGRIVVATSTDRGATWSAPVDVSSAAQGYAFFQGLDVAPNGRVDVAFQALRARDPSTFGTGNATIDSWFTSKAPGGPWTPPVRVSSQSSDPAASAQNNLQRQFWGDYNTLVSSSATAWFISTDSRNGVGCAAVDEYQQALLSAGVAPAEDEEPESDKGGKDPASHDVGEKPAPPEHCAGQFGNTDAFVSVIAGL